MNLKEIKVFLKNQELDIRNTGNARFMDQKCTPDVLSLVAESIQNYDNDFFRVRDIWESDFSKINVNRFFKKPETSSKNLSNEYDKFFGQPIKLFEYAGIINKSNRKEKSRGYCYEVVNKDLLDWIAVSDKKAFEFLVIYLREVLRQSGIFCYFEDFINNNNERFFKKLKSSYENFIINNTPINGLTEVRRIFSKVLNPLAFDENKAGTRRGRFSISQITYDELLYNRLNFRDKEKPKNISRADFRAISSYDDIEIYNVDKAKRQVKRYQGEVSEIHPNIPGIANHAHHIFPQSAFKELSDTLENLILLTAEEHMEFSHFNSSTSEISVGYQLVCLISKANSIRHSVFDIGDDFYSISSFINVLEVGLGISFDFVDFSDFEEIKFILADHFLNTIGSNKYNISSKDLVRLIEEVSCYDRFSLDGNLISEINRVFDYQIIINSKLSSKQVLNKIVNLAID